VEGRYFDWPVGFEAGKSLKDYWQHEDHKLGETSFTHFADGTAHENRMQGNDFFQRMPCTRTASRASVVTMFTGRPTTPTW
jgi:hypothetical protein